MLNQSYTFFYLNGKSIKLQLTVKDSFKESVKHVIKRKARNGVSPYMVLDDVTKKFFYFDEQKFIAFKNNELSEAELFEAVECEGIYRNSCILDFGKNDLIEVDHLWLLKNGNFILVDEERYVPVKAPDENFVEV